MIFTTPKTVMRRAIQVIEIDMKIKLKTGGEAQTSATTRTKYLQSYLYPSNTVLYQILMVLLHLRQHTGAIMQAQPELLNHQTGNMRIPT
jgi:hypothetical protein